MAATLAAARGAFPGRRLVLAFQPHRYTRTRDLLDDFAEALSAVDRLLVTEVYAAGEAPIEGTNHMSLAEGIRVRGHRSVLHIDEPKQLAPLVKGLVQPGDIVVCLGAGTITQWAYALPGQLAALDGERST